MIKRTALCRFILAVVTVAIAPTVMWAQNFKDSYRIPLPVDPATLAAGDLNGDGVADFVWVDGTTSPASINVLLSKPTRGWLPAASVPFSTVTTRVPSCLLLDVNGDNRLDLACADANQFTFYIHVFLGNGDGTFQAAIETVVPTNSGAWAAPLLYPLADVNGDGFPDLYAEDAVNETSNILLSDGKGGFKTPLPVWSSTNWAPVTAADVNGDGVPDLLFSVGPQVAVGKGDGTFKLVQNYSDVSYYAASCLFHDMDGDGHLDAVCGYPETSTGDITGATDLIVLHGNADGSFNTTPIAKKIFGDHNNEFDGFGTFLVPVAIADVNGDGVLDVLGTSGDGLAVVLGAPGLMFTKPLHYARAQAGFSGGVYRYYENLTFDVNGDGIPDAVDAGPNGIYISFARGDGTYASAFAPEVTEYIGYPTVADFNGDGIPDIAATGDTAIKLSLGKGDGTFDAPVALSNNDGAVNFSTPLSATNAHVVHGDFNGDGKLDLLAIGSSSIYNYSSYLLFGNGDGTFKNPVLVPATNTDYPLYEPLIDSSVVDINKDGKSDVLAYQPGAYGGATGQISFSLSDGDGTFRTVTTAVSVDQSGSAYPVMGLPALGDFDNDGELDAVYGSVTNAYVVKGHGDGTFGTAPTLLAVPALSGFVTMGVNAVATGDLDGDGNQDFAVLMQYGTLNTYVFPTATAAWAFFGNGKGTFSAPMLIGRFDRNFTNIAAADLNRDSRADVVVKTSGTLGGGSAVGVIESLAGRTFGPELNYTAGTGDSSLAILDLNGDGWPDMVIGNGDYNIAASSITVLMNAGSLDVVNGNLVALPEPSVVAQPFTIKATLTPPTTGTLSGNVDFSIDGNAVGTSALAANAATLAVAGTYGIGQHTLTATWGGDSTYQPVALYGTHLVVAAPTTTMIVSSLNPAPAGTSVTLTATVSSPYGTPTGLVTFTDGTTTLATVTLNGGSAVYTTSSLAVGTHTITASYAASGNFAASSASLSELILGLTSSTSLSAAPHPAYVGQTVSLTAIVDGTPDVPTGTVTFLDGTAGLGSVAANASGLAMLITTFSSAGIHNLTAAYGGDSTFNASTSPVYVENVLLNPTTITVSATPNPAIVFQQISFTAQVTSSTGYVATGVVTFYANGNAIGTGTLQGARAFFSTANLAVGTYAITASFAGSTVASASTSAPFTLVIGPESSQIELTSSANPAAVGTTVTFTAKVTVPTGVPTGTLQFFDGSAMLAAGAVLNGQAVATFTTSALTLGTHPIKALYSGDTNVLPSTSEVLNESILAYIGDFSINAAPTAATVYTGESAQFQITVKSEGGFNEPLSLSCGSADVVLVCQFNPATLSGGQGSSKLTISTAAPQRASGSGDEKPGNKRNRLPAILAAALVFVFFGRRRRWSSWLILMTTCSALAFNACGGPAPIGSGTPTGKYAFTVTATFSPQNAPQLTHSTTVMLDVKSLF